MNDGRDINVTITSGTIIKAVLIIILIFALFLLKNIVFVVLAAVVIASAIEPATAWCMRHRIRRLPATVGIYLLLAVILGLFFIFFLPLLLGDALTYLNNLPDSVNLHDLWTPIQGIGFFSSSGVSGFSDQSFSIKQFIDASKYTLAGTGEGAFHTASVIFGGALSFILIIVLSFYLAVQEDGVADFLRIVSPARHQEYIINLWKRSQRKIGFWLQGQLLLGIIVGVLVYLGLMVLNIKHALILACIAAIFELIPIFGPILSAVPAVLIAGVDGGVTSALFVLGLYVIIHQFENHLLYPLVVRKIVGISPIVVILALVIGAELAGFLGAILAVPIAAALMEYLGDVEKDKRPLHKMEKKTV